MPDPKHLRPMGVRDILDESIELYRENALLFATIAAVVLLPTNLLQAAAEAMAGPSAGSTAAELGAGNVGLALVSIALRIITVVLGWFVQAALTHAIAQRYLGRQVTWQESYGVIFRRFGPLIITVLLIGVWFLLGLLACFVGVIYVAFMISLTMPAFVVEGRAGRDAIRRSWELVGFDKNKVAGVEILAWLIFGAVLFSVFVVVGLLAGIGSLTGTSPMAGFLVAAVVAVVQILLLPAVLATTVLLYFDLRIRREGFDLEMLAQELQGEEHELGR